jgi:pyruvate/2-oxoglutarate dehydrogenase complex dihydrolipoamide acyltransferase (E2) component
MSYGAGAAGFPSRNRAALALIFFMHILALFAWVRQRPERLPDVPRVVSFFLRPIAPRPDAAPVRPKPAEPPIPVSPGRLPPLPRAADALVGPQPVQPAAQAAPAAPPASPPETADPAPRLEDLHAAPTVQDAIREQKAAEGGFAAGLSRRQAGRIDRALRNGKSGVPDEPDTPMGRMRRGLEQAYNDRSTAVFEDSYTAPDGVIIYRKRIGNKSICRRSGSVSPLGMRGMVMGNEAGDVPCPKGVQWKAD